MSFRDCDNTPALFKNMFPDSAISKSFSMSNRKASYVVQDDLEPWLSSWLCENVRKSKGAFTLMFDETTTHQIRNKWICCFDTGVKINIKGKVVKSCLSIHHGNANVERSLSDNKNALTPERT